MMFNEINNNIFFRFTVEDIDIFVKIIIKIFNLAWKNSHVLWIAWKLVMPLQSQIAYYITNTNNLKKALRLNP